MRRPLDQYHTNEYLTRTLLKHTDIYGSILEPCAGKGHISSILKELSTPPVIFLLPPAGKCNACRRARGVLEEAGCEI